MTADLDSAAAADASSLAGLPLLQKTDDVRSLVDAVLRTGGQAQAVVAAS